MASRVFWVVAAVALTAATVAALAAAEPAAPGVSACLEALDGPQRILYEPLRVRIVVRNQGPAAVPWPQWAWRGTEGYRVETAWEGEPWRTFTHLPPRDDEVLPGVGYVPPPRYLPVGRADEQELWLLFDMAERRYLLSRPGVLRVRCVGAACGVSNIITCQVGPVPQDEMAAVALWVGDRQAAMLQYRASATRKHIEPLRRIVLDHPQSRFASWAEQYFTHMLGDDTLFLRDRRLDSQVSLRFEGLVPREIIIAELSRQCGVPLRQTAAPGTVEIGPLWPPSQTARQAMEMMPANDTWQKDGDGYVLARNPPWPR